MPSSHKFTIRFPGIPKSDATRLASELEKELKSSGVEANRSRDDEAAMDFGATIVMVLGAPAVVIAAKALNSWVTRKNAGTIRIEDETGEVVVTGVESKDMPSLVTALSKRAGQSQV